MGTTEYVVCSFNVLVIWIIGYRFLGIVIVSLYIMDDKTDWWAVVGLDTFSISYKYSCVPYSNSHYMFSYSLFRKHELELISFSCTYIYFYCVAEAYSFTNNLFFHTSLPFLNGLGNCIKEKYCLRRKKFMNLSFD